MALWFKKKHAPTTALLTFNRADLYKTLQSQWEVLYELKDEISWKLVMAQLERIKNIYILDMNNLKFDKNVSAEYARQKGRIEALVTFENLVMTELATIKQRHETKGKDRHGEKTVTEDLRRNRPQAGPSLAL